MQRVSTLSILCIRLALWLVGAGALIAPTLQAQSAGTPGSWSIKAPAPIKLVEVAVAAANGKIYVLGGSAADRVFQPLNQEYDPATDRWRERAPPPPPLQQARAPGINGEIYVLR